jgi:uroporphyrinogen-III synthase
VTAIGVPSPKPADAIIFTSAHAVHNHPRDQRKDLPAFTLGDYAQEGALVRGYRNSRTARDLVRLKELIVSAVRPGARLLMFTSNDFGTAFSEDLAQSGYEVDRQVVYETSTSTDDELRPALEILDEIDGIAVYSPKGAERIAGLLSRPGSGWRGTIFCLSQTSADRLSIPDGPTIRVADEPSKRALHNVVHRTWRRSRSGLRRHKGS